MIDTHVPLSTAVVRVFDNTGGVVYCWILDRNQISLLQNLQVT